MKLFANPFSLARKLKKSREATKYCLKFIDSALGSKVTINDYKHILAKVKEIES